LAVLVEVTITGVLVPLEVDTIAPVLDAVTLADPEAEPETLLAVVEAAASVAVETEAELDALTDDDELLVAS